MQLPWVERGLPVRQAQGPERSRGADAFSPAYIRPTRPACHPQPWRWMEAGFHHSELGRSACRFGWRARLLTGRHVAAARRGRLALPHIFSALCQCPFAFGLFDLLGR